MTSNELEKLCAARPFRPFALCLADGRSIQVSSTEFIDYKPGTRLLFVNDAEGAYEAIDLLLVVSVKVSAPIPPAA